MPKEAFTTAETLRFFNNLFDVLNGYSRHDKPNPNRVRMCNKSHHVEFLREAKGKIHNMRFENKQTLEPERCIPSLENLEATIDLYIAMWNKLKSLGMTLRPRSCFFFYFWFFSIFDRVFFI